MAHQINLTACPCCHTYMSQASNTGDDCTPPKDGDFCICANCASILTYVGHGRKMKFNLPTSDDINKAISDGIYNDLLKAQAYIKSGRHGYHNTPLHELN